MGTKRLVLPPLEQGSLWSGCGGASPASREARTQGVRLGPAVTAQLLHSKNLGCLFPSLESLSCCQLPWPELQRYQRRHLHRPTGWPFSPTPRTAPLVWCELARNAPDAVQPPVCTKHRDSAASCRPHMGPALPGDAGRLPDLPAGAHAHHVHVFVAPAISPSCSSCIIHQLSKGSTYTFTVWWGYNEQVEQGPCPHGAC